MTGLIAMPIALPDSPEAQVAADDWFPPVQLERVRACLQLGGGSITEAQLQWAIEGGLLSALRLLADWRSAHALAGAASIADVAAPRIAGRSSAALLWERAVAYFAGADLSAENTDLSATDTGMNRGEEKASKADEYRRAAHAAIADLLSIGGSPVPRNTVRLI